MLRATVRKGLPGRAPFLLLGALVLGGVFVFLPSGAAQNPATKTQPKAPPPKGETLDDPFKKETPPKTTKLELHKGSGSDVVGAVQLINEKLEEGWKKNKITPSRQATDAEFIRRASLDIVGRIAKPSELEQFYKDPEATRRSLLIDRLLDNEDYPRHWANLWSNWLLGRAGAFGRGQYHEQMDVWLEDQFAQNASYDKIVTALITAKGSNKENGSVNFILAYLGEQLKNTQDNPKRVEKEGHYEMVPLTSRVTRLFLGTQVQCAQCHDHPFLGNLKQNQFWGVNAFLRQVNRPEPMAMQNGRMMTFPALTLVDDDNVNTDAQVLYEKRNGVELFTKAEFLPSGEGKRGERMPAGTKGAARREKLAEYLVAHENFPKAIVNRMWGVFSG